MVNIKVRLSEMMAGELTPLADHRIHHVRATLYCNFFRVHREKLWSAAFDKRSSYCTGTSRGDFLCLVEILTHRFLKNLIRANRGQYSMCGSRTILHQTCVIVDNLRVVVVHIGSG